MVCRKTDRRQSRRDAWEEQEEPAFYSTVTLPVVPADVFADVPAEILPVVKKYAQRFHRAITLPDPCDELTDKHIRRCVYSLRHANRLRIKMKEDAVSREPDYPGSLEGICRAFQEEVLAQRGLRSAAHGISRVDPNDPSKGFRCQAWGEIGGQTVQGIRVGHIHIGYAKSETEAYRLVAAWWLKNRRIDITVCFSPDSAIAALASMMRDASINAGNAREDAEIAKAKVQYAEVTPDEIFGDDDD